MIDPTRLSLAELVAQTMILPLYGSSSTTASSDQRAANESIYGTGTPADIIAKLRPGGVLLLDRIPFHPHFGHLPLGSLGDPARLMDFTAGLQSVAKQEGLPPLLVVADQEGGNVNRLPVPPLPAPSAIGSAGHSDLAERAGRLTGMAARQHGVNLVLGPVADIVSPKGQPNPAIGDRSFGSDPTAVADMVAATITGIGSAGVAATAKHWPGHGRADADSHVQLPVLNTSRSEWRATEAISFVAAVEAGVDAILVAHLGVPSLDPTGRPASISAEVHDLLRIDTNFEGVILTDALWMPGIRQQVLTDPEVGLAALAAGSDCLLAAPDPAGTCQLAATRQDLRPRLEQAVGRSLALRERFGSQAPLPESFDWDALTAEFAAELSQR